MSDSFFWAGALLAVCSMLALGPCAIYTGTNWGHFGEDPCARVERLCSDADELVLRSRCVGAEMVEIMRGLSEETLDPSRQSAEDCEQQLAILGSWY